MTNTEIISTESLRSAINNLDETIYCQERLGHDRYVRQLHRERRDLVSRLHAA